VLRAFSICPLTLTVCFWPTFCNTEVAFEDEIIKAFAKFDTIGDGYLTEKQLAEVRS
jgi:hypothetical protein